MAILESICSGWGRVVEFFSMHLTDEKHTFNPVKFIFIVVVIGSINGAVASAYYHLLEALVELNFGVVFHALVDVGMFSDSFPVYNYVWLGSFFYIIILCVLVFFFPKADTSEFNEAVETIHNDSIIPPSAILPMLVFSLLSVASGCGVGPEAPILVIGGATASFIGMKLKVPKRTLRIMTLTGCYASLSAFFGEPVSGLYALEFPHRLGFEFFEAFPTGVASSFISSTIFQPSFRRPYGYLFDAETDIVFVHPVHLGIGLLIGIFAAIVVFLYWSYVRLLRVIARKLKFRSYRYATPLIAWVIASVACMLLPPVMFWGEPDIQNVLDLNATPLPKWQGGSSGIIPLGDTYTLATVIMVGVAKILVMAPGVVCGLKGGILFPMFAVGGSFGLAISMITGVDKGMAIGCTMAAIQAGITRTPLSSTMVVGFFFPEFRTTMLVPIAAATFMCYYLTYPFSLFAAQSKRIDFKHHQHQHQQEPVEMKKVDEEAPKDLGESTPQTPQNNDEPREEELDNEPGGDGML